MFVEQAGWQTLLQHVRAASKAGQRAWQQASSCCLRHDRRSSALYPAKPLLLPPLPPANHALHTQVSEREVGQRQVSSSGVGGAWRCPGVLLAGSVPTEASAEQTASAVAGLPLCCPGTAAGADLLCCSSREQLGRPLSLPASTHNTSCCMPAATAARPEHPHTPQHPPLAGAVLGGLAAAWRHAQPASRCSAGAAAGGGFAAQAAGRQEGAQRGGCGCGASWAGRQPPSFAVLWHTWLPVPGAGKPRCMAAAVRTFWVHLGCYSSWGPAAG